MDEVQLSQGVKATEPLGGKSLLFTTKSLGDSGTQCIKGHQSSNWGNKCNR